MSSISSKGIKLSRNAVIVLFCTAILLGAWWTGFLAPLGIQGPASGGSGYIPGITSPTQGGGYVSVTKPIQFSVMDSLAGSKVVSASVYLYDTNGKLLESLTTDGTTGLVSSSVPYASGTVLNVKVAKTNYVTVWETITVPYMNEADAQALTTNYYQLETYTLGTYSFTAVNSAGSAISSADTINITNYASTPYQITFSVRNSVDNTGYISSHDEVNNIDLNAAVLTSSSTSYMTIQNAGTYAPRGTVSNWIQVMDDDGLTKEKVGNTYVKQGVQSFTLTFYKGTLTSAANQTVTLDLYKYFDAGYFAAQGIGGPDASTAASQFTLTFYTA